MKNYWLDKNKTGFPMDDEFSIMQGDNGCANLDIYYTQQFVQGETIEECKRQTKFDYFYDLNICSVNYWMTEHTPVIAGTMTGEIYVSDKLVQNFIVNSQGMFDLSKKFGETFIISANLNLNTGEVFAKWNVEPDTKTKLVVNYEFNIG